MQTHQPLHKRILKDIESFRSHQKKSAGSESDDIKNEQYREIQDILSPFWAWRGKSL